MRASSALRRAGSPSVMRASRLAHAKRTHEPAHELPLRLLSDFGPIGEAYGDFSNQVADEANRDHADLSKVKSWPARWGTPRSKIGRA